MRVHPTADVSPNAVIGEGTSIWNQCQIREGANIGKNCVLSKNVYIDHDVKIGDNCKIQNNVSVYFDAELEEGVFIGPHVCFTNDKIPRAINIDGTPKGGGSDGSDWKIEKITIHKGAAIGANSTLLPGITIGKWAMIAAGSIVTKDVPDYALMVGTPAKCVGYVCPCGRRVNEEKMCTHCNTKII